jgi:hypothetical protein
VKKIKLYRSQYYPGNEIILIGDKLLLAQQSKDCRENFSLGLSKNGSTLRQERFSFIWKDKKYSQRQIAQNKKESKNRDAGFLRETKCESIFDIFSFDSKKRYGSDKVSSMFHLSLGKGWNKWDQQVI